MSFDFVLGGSLECVSIDIGVFPVGEGVVVKRTAVVGVGLGLHDFAPYVFELSFKGQLVLCFLLKSFHHLVYCFVPLLFQTLVFSLES